MRKVLYWSTVLFNVMAGANILYCFERPEHYWRLPLITIGYFVFNIFGSILVGWPDAETETKKESA